MVIACSALRNPEIAASAGDGDQTRARRTLVRRFHREISPSCSAHRQAATVKVATTAARFPN